MTLTAPTWGIISHSKPNTLYGQPVHRIWSHVTISGGVKFKSRSATWSWPCAFVRACYWCCLEVTLSALNATESDVDIEALSEHQLTTWHLLLCFFNSHCCEIVALLWLPLFYLILHYRYCVHVSCLMSTVQLMVVLHTARLSVGCLVLRLLCASALYPTLKGGVSWPKMNQ